MEPQLKGMDYKLPGDQ